MLGMNLTKKIKEYAHKLGFDLVGIVPATKPQTIDFYEDWLDKGFGAEMSYLRRHLKVKKDPSALLNGAKSVICLGINYFTADIPEERKNDPSRGIISRYAWGLDYHNVIKQKLEELHSFINFAYHSELDAKFCVDTVPLLEREFAGRAGIGWIGKSSNLINREYGSWLFLAELILTKELVYDKVEAATSTGQSGGRFRLRHRCGTCTRCLDACPTNALIAPHTLDSRKCISYLTIEHKGIIPRELRPAIGNRIFGCDVCQEVCPWNRHAKRTDEQGFFPRKMRTTPKLLELMRLTDGEFRNRFKNSPIERTKRRGLLRNVAIAIGNWGDRSAVPVLIEALNDPEPLVRIHVAWALGRCGGQEAKDALRNALNKEK